jgi:serine/threonine-protein kinase
MAHDRLRRFLGEGAAAGRYELGAPLGEGGMGAVFEGWDPKLERRVALKLFKTGDAERIRREAAAAARLAHPGIVAIYEVGPDFIAMEAIAGPTLAVAWPTMSPPERLRVLGSVADAVAYAHAAGVVHGDLKPSNVLLRHGHEPVLTDFGLARGVDGEVAEIPGGTLPHLAPEVLRGERRSPRNDVWSLGVMTYELLAGRRPFAGETAAALAQEIAHATPETFRHRCVPVILRALARAPADRFADAGAFAQALRAASDEPARAPAPTRVRGRAIWLVGALFAGLALWRVMAGTPTDPGGDPRLGAYREAERWPGTPMIDAR